MKNEIHDIKESFKKLEKKLTKEQLEEVQAVIAKFGVKV